MFNLNIRRQILAVIAVFAWTSALATPPPPPAPKLEDLANASYKGLIDAEGVITLSDGCWQGEPWVEGGASAPSAQLVGTLVVQGDVPRFSRSPR